MTEKVFKENAYIKELDAVVTSFVSNLVTFDKTIFFPTGGGQPNDIGEIHFDGNVIKILDVFEKDGEIFHKVDFKIEVGAKVKEVLDWDRRFTNMQRHSGEHILTGIFYREYGAVNRGFHMGENYMTIDLSFEEDDRFKELTFEMAKKVELLANEVIWNAYPFVTKHFDKKEDALKYEMRKKLALDSDITLVGIKDMNTKWGLVACCGTHVKNASEVGLIKIFKVEPNKGMYRVYFETGRLAFLKYQKELDILNQIGKNLSVSNDDILKKMEIDSERENRLHKDLSLVKKELISREIKRIIDEKIEVVSYEYFNVDDFNSIAKEIFDKITNILFLVSRKDNIIILASNNIDCNKIVQEKGKLYNGKGGGSKNIARIKFEKEEDLNKFIEER